MRHINGSVKFPLILTWPDGTREQFSDVKDLECNLEDFDSDNIAGALLFDAEGRRICLKMSMTWINKLELLNGN